MVVLWRLESQPYSSCVSRGYSTILGRGHGIPRVLVKEVGVVKCLLCDFGFYFPTEQVQTSGTFTLSTLILFTEVQGSDYEKVV